MTTSSPADRPSARLTHSPAPTSDSTPHLTPTLPLLRSGSHAGGSRQSAHARALLRRLSDRDIDVLVTLGRLRLLTGRHVQRLFLTSASPVTAARRSRAILQRLTDLHAVVRLDRRVGGVRAGSDGHLYGLSGLGRAALSLEAGAAPAGRPIAATKPAFQDHILAISELYVQLRERQAQSQVELLHFAAEPDCWRPYPGPGGGRIMLKPDAHVVLGVGDYEQHSFIELDLGTESGPTLLRKCQRYLEYWRSGLAEQAGGVFPRVWWLAPTERRLAQIQAVVERLAPAARDLFTVAAIDRAVGRLAEPDEPEADS